MTATETTGRRPDWYSKRHRGYGTNLPMADCDVMYLEYDRGEPRGFAQLRDHLATPPPFLLGEPDPSMRAWWRIAQKQDLPLWFAQYWEDSGAFRVYPLNQRATDLFHVAVRKCTDLTEEGYVRKLYELRGRAVPIEEINRGFMREGKKPLGQELPSGISDRQHCTPECGSFRAGRLR